ncbi:hypothetical protein ACFX19_022971 [Malus domestica]
MSRHARPRRSSPSCRDEKEREKDDADDDGCACVYVGLGPSAQGERRETTAAAMKEKQKPIWVSVRVCGSGRRIERRTWVGLGRSMFVVVACGRTEKGEKGLREEKREGSRV